MDELSAPVLALNLPGSSGGGADRALALARELGEPTRISTRQLLRDPPTLALELIPERTVFVYENPSVVAAAAIGWARAAAPCSAPRASRKRR